MGGPKENSQYRLLVEGPDDKWSIINLMMRNQYDWMDDETVRPFVQDTGGIDTLLSMPVLTAALKTYVRLGLVIDADINVADRWVRVRECFRQLHLELPKEPSADGTIVPGGRASSRVGIWLMPDNQNPGILEHFLATLVPAGDCCWPHAELATKDARTKGAPLKEKDIAKGVLHTWLAWREDPGLPFGTAITASVLGGNSHQAMRFVDWFRRLFVEP